jgi:hypothetical protein
MKRGLLSALFLITNTSLFGLLRFFRLHCRFSGLEADLRMRSITKWLVYRRAAAAQRIRGLAGQVIFIPVRIYQLNQAFWIFHPVRPISSDRNLHLRHDSPLVGKKNIGMQCITRVEINVDVSRLLFRNHIHQQLVAFDVDHITEGSFSSAGEVESHAALAYAQIAQT